MKSSEIRELSAAELNEKLSDLKTELFNLRFQHAVNQLDNPMRLKVVKKDIAGLMTIIKENERKAQEWVKGGLTREREKPEKNPGGHRCQRQDG